MHCEYDGSKIIHHRPHRFNNMFQILKNMLHFDRMTILTLDYV